MIIHFNSTDIVLAVNDNSYRYRAIKGEHSLTLYYSLPEHIEIPLGAYCVFEGETYTLETPENFKKHNTRNFEYTLIMDSAQAKLKKYKFKDTTSRRLKFSLTAKPHEHLKMLVDNMNQRDTGWVAGECVDAVEKVISYNHALCSDALSQMADEFETEWEIVEKTINLRKVEYNKDNPLPLSYGRGNGFRSGVGRTSGDKKPIEVLFVQGGERNIDSSKYGSSELLLPKNQEIGYDGEYFSDQEGFDSEKARWYITDSDGFSLRRSDKPLSSHVEDSLDCSHIYPSRIGTIDDVIVVNAYKNFYDIVDNSIPSGLNFDDYLIAGEMMTIIFQSGMLAGKEFDVKYKHNGRRFEIVPQELDGRTMPDDVFKPQIGQQYAVFGMMLPEAYICDNDTKTGASWNMFREAVKYKYENEGQKFTFTGELDGIWAKKDWLNIGGRIKLGGYVLFSDNQFEPSGVSIRIVGIKDFINDPYKPSIELSNEIVGSSIRSSLRKIETNEIVMDETTRNAVQFTKRRFRDSQETLSMLEDALLDKFTNSISPITVQTMAMLVGDESLQFRFVNNKTIPVTVSHAVTFNSSTKKLTSAAGVIQHMTLGITAITSQRPVSEYRFWDIQAFESPPLTDGSKKYYLYAKVEKEGTAGTFYLSETAIAMESVAGYYHLLTGILNSEFDGERNYVDLYGFSEVLPGRITTEKVVSADGKNFIDFLNNAFRVGNSATSIDFNTQGDGKLRLKGTLVQSTAGEQPIGFFRGAYNSAYTYYEGDQVTYNGATFRYIYSTPITGIAPTNSTYWIAIAERGEDGAAPDWKSFVYIKSPTVPAKPNSSYIIPEGWQDYPDSEATGNDKWWMAVATIHWNGEEWLAGTFIAGDFYVGSWSQPIQVTGEQGTDGQFVDFKFRSTSDMNPPTWNSTLAAMLNPTGWLDNPPQLPANGAVWMITAWKQAGGTQLISNWDAPARISGDKGENPALVYRGEYNKDASGKTVVQTYYGTNTRVDCVKYNNAYYVARIDAGNGFSGILPTDTNKWNPFGASFDSIATGLLLAEMANIGDWIIKDGKITSRKQYDGTDTPSVATSYIPKAQLDGNNGGLILASSVEDIIAGNGVQKITLNSDIASIRAEMNVSGGGSYGGYGSSEISSQGIIANRAGKQSVSAVTGMNKKGAIVGLGYGNVEKSIIEGFNFICGVYGIAKNSNSNPAPAYGGYFEQLMAKGLNLGTKIFSDTEFNVDYHQYLAIDDTVVLAINNSISGTILVPNNPYNGMILFISAAGDATLNVRALKDTMKLFSNVWLGMSNYYVIGKGNTVTLTFYSQSTTQSANGFWKLNKIGY